jgi:hypothetical protein
MFMTSFLLLFKGVNYSILQHYSIVQCHHYVLSVDDYTVLHNHPEPNKLN